MLALLNDYNTIMWQEGSGKSSAPGPPSSLVAVPIKIKTLSNIFQIKDRNTECLSLPLLQSNN